MTATGPADPRPAPPATAGQPVVDLGAVLAAMQDQIDDLTATVEAQQRTIDELVRARRAPAGAPPPRRPGPR